MKGLRARLAPQAPTAPVVVTMQYKGLIYVDNAAAPRELLQQELAKGLPQRKAPCGIASAGCQFYSPIAHAQVTSKHLLDVVGVN